jgi:hypothetical protein
MDGESENGYGTSRSLSGLSGKAVFFGYFLLLAPAVLALRAGFAVRAFGAVGQQKKVPRLQAKALDLESGYQRNDRCVTTAWQY